MKDEIRRAIAQIEQHQADMLGSPSWQAEPYALAVAVRFQDRMLANLRSKLGGTQ